jgi:hypothetical protein
MASIMSGLLALTMAAASTPSPKPAEKPVSVVLVHGAFVDASGYRRILDRLWLMAAPPVCTGADRRDRLGPGPQ